MNHNARFFCFLAVVLAVMSGCSSEPAANSKKTAYVLDKIQGKAQVLQESGGATEAALNPGGPSVYIWEGMHRYRLFLRNTLDVVHGKEYIVEGVYAQKAIDEIGDPEQGKTGYPLQSSCERVAKMAWSTLSFDAVEPTAALIRSRVKRYPARPLFLVARIIAVAPGNETKKDDADDDKIPEISVPADKQKALLIEGPTVLTAPLWEPKGGTVHCKAFINPDGKITKLDTGEQLCESVPWAKFRYQPSVQGGHPVRVKTEVEVRFDPRT